jgi:predicted ATPase
MLHHHCIEFDMDSATDYRDGAGNALLHFHTGAGGANDEVLAFAGSSSARLSEHTVDVGFGRQLLVTRADVLCRFPLCPPPPPPHTHTHNSHSLPLHYPPQVSAGVAVFSFDELCDEYLGAGDYRAVARTFNRIGLLDVPKLTLQDHDQARRFITLVDELYEAGCKLSISAQFEPKLLFEDSGVAGGGEVDLGEDAGGNYAVGGQKWLDVRQATGRMLGELASVRELRFAFQRAASRLTQMTSGEWHGE